MTLPQANGQQMAKQNTTPALILPCLCPLGLKDTEEMGRNQRKTGEKGKERRGKNERERNEGMGQEFESEGRRCLELKCRPR